MLPKNVQNLTELLTVIMNEHSGSYLLAGPARGDAEASRQIQIQFSTREGLVKTHNGQASDRTLLCRTADLRGPRCTLGQPSLLRSWSENVPRDGNRPGPSPQPAFPQEAQLGRRNPALPGIRGRVLQLSGRLFKTLDTATHPVAIKRSFP